MKQLFIFLGCLLAIGGCSNPAENNSKNEKIVATGTGFPLKTGNSWELSYTRPLSSTSFQRWNVNRDTVFNANIYAMIITYHNDDVSDTLFIRQDFDGKVFKYLNGQEFLWLDPTLPSGETYSYPFSDNTNNYSVTVTHNVKYTINNDTVINCICFGFDVPEIIDEETTYYYAPGVGIVAIDNGWVRVDLKSAVLQ